MKKLASYWDKFILLMWKNFLLMRRHKIQTFLEIFTPVFFSGLLVMIRALVNPEIINEVTRYHEIPLNNLDHLRLKLGAKQIEYKLVYSPYNENLEKIIFSSVKYLKLDDYVSVNNSDDLKTFMLANNFLAGIVFPDQYANLTVLPNDFMFTIRYPSKLRTGKMNKIRDNNWVTDMAFPIWDIGGARNDDENDGGLPPGYYAEGFLDIQNCISKSFIEMKTDRTNVPEIAIKRYPYPPHHRDPLLQGLGVSVSIIIVLSFVYPCINLIKGLVERVYIATEKELQLKESMKIMGLPNWLHWLAWFIRGIILMMISCSITVLILKLSWTNKMYVSVFTNTNWSIIWLLFFAYTISTISFCFMMSVMFSKANTASAVAGLVWFIMYTPYTFTQDKIMSLIKRLAYCLFSNTAMSYGFHLIVWSDGNGGGLQWDNIWDPPMPMNDLSLGYVIMMLLIDAILYFIITLYVEKINPGTYGVPEVWYFPFTKQFWCRHSSSPTDLDYHDEYPRENVDIYPTDIAPGIKLKGLRKLYQNKKIAVHGLTMNIYKDQITVLLGHNGAGKTTTMSMLTGMFKPTSGTAIIDGKDIRSDKTGVRSSLGFCPQHNILFDELTVREHIIFYSRLKGLEWNEIETEVKNYVELLELQPKIDTPAFKLSGGMQRKLSVGVALCGGSKVVFCDEPTSGMDPKARRALWDLLQKEKKGRTILLTTHFMDEADILGDRIAIMAEGHLKAYGSSFFLKKTFGAGYYLICVKGPMCNVMGVTDLLRKYVPIINILSNVGSELSYELPEKYVDQFKEMLGDLELNSTLLGLVAYGISLTTLEEVFMKVGADDANLEILRQQKIINDDMKFQSGSVSVYSGSILTVNSEIELTPSLQRGIKLVFYHIIAMFEKKCWYTISNWLQLLIQIVIPIVFLSLTIITVRLWAGGNDLPICPISFLNYLYYRGSVEVLQPNPNIPVNSFASKIIDGYKQLRLFDGKLHTLKIIDEHFEDFILDMAHKDITLVNEYFIAGATIDRHKIVAWFNNKAYHSASLSLNLVHNSILQAAGCGSCFISVNNHPLPYTAESWMEMLNEGNNIGHQLAFHCGSAMAFVAAFYVTFYIKERASRAKLLQLVSGINIYIFWITAFIWDFFTYIMTTIAVIITFAIFQEAGFRTFMELMRLVVVYLSFGFSILPVSYLFSMFFNSPSTGFVRSSMCYIFTGTALFVTIFTLKSNEFHMRELGESLTSIFMVFPHFAFCDALSNINVVNTILKTCDRSASERSHEPTGCPGIPMCCNRDYFQWNEPGIGRNIACMLIVGIISFVTVLLIDLRVPQKILLTYEKLLGKSKKCETNQTQVEDVDVRNEKIRVNEMTMEDIRDRNLVFKNLTKYYSNFLAVNGISVAVSNTECFGLLGVNGAGKTSTFKMLTGDENISDGYAWVKGNNLKENMKKVHLEIGYCPQFNALLEDLTGRQTLRIYSLLRGIPLDQINGVSAKLAHDLNFLGHIDKKISQYSGGNKRKLSTAIALLGNPSVIYLDEPTSGMDPGAKRQLWNVLCKVRDSGKTIILTSHSMEECEALCTRLAIMVNGEFKCIGSTQYLKTKFSEGYLMSIKIKRNDETNIAENMKSVKQYVSHHFPKAVLKEEYQSFLTYDIPKTGQKWSEMFGVMQAGKVDLNIEDYSLSQTSLEQVFLSFAKRQKEENLMST